MNIEQILNKYEIKYPRCGAYIEDGWLPLVESLIQELIQAGWDKKLSQIKQKFGGLRFYVDTVNKDWRAIIDKYEEASYKVCELCGDAGKKRSIDGWLTVICNECLLDL